MATKALIEDRIEKLDRSSVFDVINRGGTFLASGESFEFKDVKVREKGIENLGNTVSKHLLSVVMALTWVLRN